MGKERNYNPADAARKAQKKKDIKKNRTERTKARDLAIAKTDISVYEDEIRELESKGEERSSAETLRLSDLRSEVHRVNQKKEQYVSAHPEERKLIYRSRRRPEAAPQSAASLASPKKNLFDKNGLPRHPERSVYFDATFNPYGVPPPGMPYVERPPLPGEVRSDVEESGESDGEDDDIAMPDDDPPSDEEDDIPLPDGPPPWQNEVFEHMASISVPPLPMSAMKPNHMPMATYMAPPNLNPIPSNANSPRFIPLKPQAATARPLTASAASSAVISAEPELRDLKKESTAFVPSALLRQAKKQKPRVNASPAIS